MTGRCSSESATVFSRLSFLLLILFSCFGCEPILQPVDRSETADLEMVLPVDSNELQDGVTEMVMIKIADDSSLTVNGEPASLEELERVLQEIQKTTAKPLVSIDASDKSQSSRFVDVLNVLAKLGINDVTLAGFKQ